MDPRMPLQRGREDAVIAPLADPLPRNPVAVLESEADLRRDLSAAIVLGHRLASRHPGDANAGPTGIPGEDIRQSGKLQNFSRSRGGRDRPPAVRGPSPD